MWLIGTFRIRYVYRDVQRAFWFSVVGRNLSQSLVIELEGAKKPLGIHVLPDYYDEKWW